MQFLVRLIIPIIISFGWVAVLNIIDKESVKSYAENRGKDHVVITMPKIYRIIAYVGLIFFIFCLCLSVKSDEQIWVYMGFIILSLLCLALLTAMKLWKIDYYKDKDYFIFRSAIGKKHTVFYKDCVECTERENDIIIKTNNKNIVIEKTAINNDVLVSRVKRMMNTDDKNRSIFICKSSPTDKVVIIVILVIAIAFMLLLMFANSENLFAAERDFIFSMFLSCIFLVISFIICIKVFFDSITIDEEKGSFIFRTILKKREIKYEDCKNYILNSFILCIRTKNKKLFFYLILSSKTNVNKLIKHLNKTGNGSLCGRK